MNTPSLRNAILTISVALIMIYVFVPESKSLFSYLVVVGFVGFTLYLTLDGQKKKEKLIHKDTITNLETAIKIEIKNFYSQNKSNHEKINRIALIDSKCVSNDDFQKWEKGRRDYQSLPNFLLSIGLLGTFAGITINLFQISLNTSGTVELQTILPGIISSMAIAFISSLAALGCSMYLTKFHPTSDLEIVKNNLLISLENYVDNEYLLLPTNQSKGKIDKLIDSINDYSQKLNNFVSSLDQNTQKFQNAMTFAANTLNISANNFQTVVNQSSQSMQTGANVLINATNSIAGLTTKFSDLISSLVQSSTSFDQATYSLKIGADALNNTNSNIIELTNKFTDITTSLLQSASVFEQTVSTLQKYTTTMKNVNKTIENNSKQVQNFIQNNQNNLNGVSGKLLQNSETISTFTQSLNQNITQVSTSLNQYITQIEQQSNNLQTLTGVIENTAQSSNINITQVSVNLDKNAALLNNQIQQLQGVATKIEQNTQLMERILLNL